MKLIYDTQASLFRRFSSFSNFLSIFAFMTPSDTTADTRSHTGTPPRGAAEGNLPSDRARKHHNITRTFDSSPAVATRSRLDQLQFQREPIKKGKVRRKKDDSSFPLHLHSQYRNPRTKSTVQRIHLKSVFISFPRTISARAFTLLTFQ